MCDVVVCRPMWWLRISHFCTLGNACRHLTDEGLVVLGVGVMHDGIPFLLARLVD